MRTGSIEETGRFLGRSFQRYGRGAKYDSFRESPHGSACVNPVIVGFIKTGRLAWMEQWIEVCKEQTTGKYGFGIQTACDTCEGHNVLNSFHCFFEVPHPNYKKGNYCFDSVEDAIRGAVTLIESVLARRGDGHNKGTRKMVELALAEIAPREEQLSLW